MADTTYKINIETQQATRSLDALKASLGSLTGAFASAFAVDKVVQIAAKFESLRVSLGILYKDTAAGAQAFERIKTVAANSVFSVDDLSAAFIKLKSAGIEPTDRQLQLFADVSSVAADSVGALQAMTDLFARTTAGGLGLEDLNRLADRGIPVFNILSEKMGLSRLEVAKFGQSAQGAQKILAVLTTELEKTFGGASAARAKTLAQAMAQVDDAVKNLIDRTAQAGPGNALTDLLQKLADFINGININQINILVENIKNLVIAIGSLMLVKSVGPAIIELGMAMTRTGPSAKGMTDSLRAMSPAFDAFISGTKNVVRELEYLPTTFNRALGGGPAGSLDKGLKMLGNSFFFIAGQITRMLPMLGQLYIAFEILDSALTLITGKNIKGWFDELAYSLENLVTGNFPKLAEMLNKLGEKLGMAPPPSVVRENEAEIERLKKRAEASKKLNEEQKRSPLAEQNYALDRLRVTYAMLGIEAARYTEQLRNRLGFEAGVISMGEEQAEVETKLREEAERYQRRIEELQDKQIQLRTAMIGEKDTNKLQEYGLEIELINKLIKDSSDAHLRNREVIERGVAAIQSARYVEEARKANLENITKEMERQAELQGKLRDIILESGAKLEEETFKRNKKFGLAGQIEEIQRTNRLAAEEAARSFASNFEVDETGNIRNADLLAQGLDRIATTYLYINQLQIEQLQYSRTWAAGWDEAFTRFKDNAYNAADEAKTYFETFTRGFESAITRAVQTGKLSFRDLFKSLAAEILKIQANKLMANFLGASGVGGFFRNLFGGGFGTGASYGNMDFGGFFANGGTLGAGKWGIAGEAGPELITGPANITPMGKQQPVTVNYNISAVDAASFRALVARDPQFIYNITEQGRRSQPTRRL
jgi:hypothetical protein